MRNFFEGRIYHQLRDEGTSQNEVPNVCPAGCVQTGGVAEATKIGRSWETPCEASVCCRNKASTVHLPESVYPELEA